MKLLATLSSFLLLLIPALAPAQIIVGTQGFLLFRDDVKKELKLTPDQATKIEKMTSELLEDMGDGRKMVRMPSDHTQESFDKMLIEPLTPDQRTRIRGLWLQYRRGSALVYPDVQKELALTDKQKKQVEGVKEWIVEEMQAMSAQLMEEHINGGKKVSAKLDAKISEKFLAILTPEQKKQLEEMMGKPFKFDPPRGLFPISPRNHSCSCRVYSPCRSELEVSRIPCNPSPRHGDTMKTDRTKLIVAALMFIIALAVPAIAAAQVPFAIAGTPGYLLFQDDVRKELKLSAAQAEKVDKIMKDSVQDAGDGRKYIRFTEGFSIDEYNKSLVAPLEAEQVKRLKELWLQLRGGLVVTVPEIQKELELTKSQKDDVNGVLQWYRDEIQAAAMEAGGGVVTVSAELIEKTKEKLEKLLTADQKKKLGEMKGKPFEFKKAKSG